MSARPWLTAEEAEGNREDGGRAGRRNFEHLMEAPCGQRAVFPPEGAEAVVVRMPVRAVQPHGDILVREPLAAPAAERAARIAADEQPEHHRRRIAGRLRARPSGSQRPAVSYHLQRKIGQGDAGVQSS